MASWHLVLFVLIAAASATAVAGQQPLDPKSTVDEILDALDARGRDLKAFTADVSLTEGDVSLANEVTRKGKVLYQDRGEGNARLRVTFATREAGRKQFDEKVEYLLDDGWLTDRTYAKSIEVKRQVLRKGEKINLLKLGEGPFPLPIGQKKESVHEQFAVKKIPSDPKADDEPKNALHVQLTPKRGTQFEKKFDAIDVWVDQKTHMPARIDTAQGDTVRTTLLTNFQINPQPELKNEDFALPVIDKSKWDLHEEPFAK